MNRTAYYLYILYQQNDKNLTFGITQNLPEILKIKQPEHQLVYYEYFMDKHLAKLKELQLRFNSRTEQRCFIHDFNPDWIDLTLSLTENHLA